VTRHTPSPTANAQDVAAKHTPGPWVVGRDSNYPSSFGIIEGPSFPISYVLWATDVTRAMGEQRDRDAALIAAAPDLFDALLAIMPSALCGEHWGLPDTESVQIATSFGKIKTARAALAKVTSL
jgi:hypothetical protein